MRVAPRDARYAQNSLTPLCKLTTVSKCDRAPQGCSQCRRKGHECPGYPDPSALRMRNETARITSKEETRNKSLSRSRSQTPAISIQSTSSLSPFIDFSDSFYNTQLSPASDRSSSSSSPASFISLAIAPNIDQHALSYLFNTFITATPFEGYLSFFHGPAANPDDALAYAIDAAALAAYARHSRRSHCVSTAHDKYSGALTRVNAALSNPETAVQDRTLAAVLVLALFEATVFQVGSHAPTSWIAHTWGAMQLLMLRGADQFSDPISKLLFSHTSNNVKASCIQRSIAIPQQFLDFDKEVRATLDQHDPTVKLANMLHKVSAIKAKSKSVEGPQDHVNTVSLILDAIKVDREVVEFCNNPPEILEYTREPLGQGPAWTFRRIVHNYPHLRLAKIWNAVRLLRIFLLSFIGDDISHFPVEGNLPDTLALSDLKAYAMEHMAEVSADVLATVPTFVYEDGSRRTFLASARCLAWPLSIIEKSSVCSADAQLYARKTLEWLAEDLNLPHAIHPERHPGSQEDWYVLTHSVVITIRC